LEQQTKNRIKPITLVALLDNVSTVFNRRAKIINGRARTMMDLMLRLIEYKTCFSS
jgi:ACR3 family arsenite efflux pump ArsB